MALVGRRKIFAISLLLVVIGTTMAFFGCNLASLTGGGSNYSRFASLASYDDGTVSIPSGKFFYIRIARASDGTDRFLQHALYEEKEGPGTDCKIPVDEESTEDMFCMLEKMEGDLWAHDTIIEYNVPAGMCKYLAFQTHWHWNQNAGRGPRKVYKCENVENEGEDNEETQDVYCDEPCGANNAPDSSANCQEEIEALCEYDLSQEDEDLANCCIGNYTVISSDGDNEEGEWGDSLENCIGGLGRVNWDEKTKDGIPTGKVVNSEQSGYIGTYKIPNIDSWYDSIAPLETESGTIIGGSPGAISNTSFVTANYYEDIEDDTSNKPHFYTPSKIDIHHTAHSKHGYSYITWACLDSGHEVMHRIHLIIRDWNSQEEFLKFKESEGSRGDPDINGSEGSDCDYYSTSKARPFGECNDAIDADDWTESGYKNTYPHVIYK